MNTQNAATQNTVEESTLVHTSEASLEEDTATLRDTLEDIVEEAIAAPEQRTIADMFAGEGAVSLSVEPRIMLTVNGKESSLPSEIKIGKKYYSLDSAMRKGDCTKGKGNGFLRDGLRDLVIHIGHLCKKKVVLFGEGDALNSGIISLVDSLNDQAQDILSESLGESGAFLVPLPKEERATQLDAQGVVSLDASANAPIEMMEIPSTELFTVSSWPAIDSTDTPNSYVLYPTININFNMPKLRTMSSITKVLSVMYTHMANYAEAAGLSEECVCVAYPFNRSDLTSSEILEMLSDHLTDEDIQYYIVSDEDCLLGSENDTLEILPTNLDAEDARTLLMPYHGDTLLVGTSYPRRSSKSKKAKKS